MFVFVCLFKCCVCVDEFVCLQAVDGSKLCLMIPLWCLSVTSGMDAVRYGGRIFADVRRLSLAVFSMWPNMWTDHTRHYLLELHACTNIHTLSCLLYMWAAGRYTVCVCVFCACGVRGFLCIPSLKTSSLTEQLFDVLSLSYMFGAF